MNNLDEFGLPIDDCGDTYNFNNCNLTLPESFGDALSYEQQILALDKYKQDKLTPGQNITIEEKDGKTVISASGELQANTYSIVKSNEELPENVEAIYNLVETNSEGESQNVGDTIEIPVIAGPAGFSPTVSVTETASGHQVDITDKDGVHSFEVENGKDGLDGSDGAAATIQVGTVETLAAGSNAYVTNAGNENAAVFNFGIPVGEDGKDGLDGSDGEAATIQIGNVETLTAGSSAYVRNSGNENAAIFDFGIPVGGDGQNGSNGIAATIQVGNVETLEAGSNAYVTNSGNENAAILNFGIPVGEQGGQGPAGPSNVTQILTEGVEIADINGTKIYAPEASGGSSNAVVVDYNTVTNSELLEHISNEKLVYSYINKEWYILQYYSESTNMDFEVTGYTYYFINVHNNSIKYKTIAYSVTNDSYTRNSGTTTFSASYNTQMNYRINQGGVAFRTGTVLGTNLHGPMLDVTNTTNPGAVSTMFVDADSLVGTNNSSIIYKVERYSYNNTNYYVRLYCDCGYSPSFGNVSQMIFTGKITLDNEIIILKRILNSSGWGDLVVKKIALSDV